MKFVRTFVAVMGVAYVLSAFWLLALPAAASTYNDACAAASLLYLKDNASCLHDTCGYGAAAVSCSGCDAPGFSGRLCCYRDTPTLEYRCLSAPPGTFMAAPAEATNVNLGLDRFTPAEPTKPVLFTPQITIPGSVTIGGTEFRIQQGEGILVTGNTIAQWLAVFYRFLVVFLAVAAVTMMSWGGFKRIMAAGSAESIKDANDVIFQAIIGLVLALISYSLLNLINPALVNFKPLDVEQIRRVEFDPSLESSEDVLPQNRLATSAALVVVQGDNISNPGNEEVDLDMEAALVAVAAELKHKAVQLIITSGTRTVDEQRQLILKNCQNPPGSATCNPRPGRFTTCMLKDGTANSCPHTSGRAVDVWAAAFGGKPISQSDCGLDKAACRRDMAMAALGQAMIAQGFCNLASEPWHFEQPKMSLSCYPTY